MKLWLIEMDKVDWDEYRGFVVSSNTEEEAIKTCKIVDTKEEAEKYSDNLFKENIEKITEIGIYNKEISEIVLSDFNQG